MLREAQLRRRHQRPRIVQTHRSAFEVLEGRLLLTGQPGSTFAAFHGVLSPSNQIEQLPITIAPTDFQTTASKALLGFEVQGAQGSLLDPAAVRIFTDTGTPITPSYLKTHVGGGAESVVLASLPIGSYNVSVSGLDSSLGGYDLNVFMVGDANTDHSVSTSDTGIIQALAGSNSASSNYLSGADANLDGLITSLDYALALRNLGVSTSVTPLSLAVALSPASPTLGDGTVLTNVAASILEGTTEPGAQVSVDVDGAGTFGAGSTIADGAGHFSLPITLQAGPGVLTVRARDAFGQNQVRELRVLLDTTAPTIGVLQPASGSFTNHNITLTGEVHDDLSGVVALQVAVDAGSFSVLGFDSAGNFSFLTGLATDGSADGPHVVHLRATDLAGNGPTTLDFPFTVDTQPPLAPQFDLSAGSVSPLAVTPGTTNSARVTLVGSTSPNVSVRLLETGATALSNNTGFFQFPDVTLALGDNTFTAQATDAAGNTSSFQRVLHRTNDASQQDPVLRWVQAALNAVQLDATAPPIASRGLAMMSAAVYDAVNAVEGKPGYYVTMSAPAGTAADAAVSGAASTMLAYLFPGQQAGIDQNLTLALSQVPDGQSKIDGLALGEAVANQIIALRSHDGWDTFIDYVPGSGPGVWQQTAPMFAPALLPQWAHLQPFAMTSPNQFLPPGPPDLSSQAWSDAFNEVKSLGAATGSTRTADQTQIARFWADGSGTYTPPGHWDLVAEQIAQQEGNSVAENARLFAELNVALGDAAIVAWNAKYDYNFWRPISAIQAADTDGNDQTTADPNWTSFLVTPNFPEYVSGHSTFSGAAADILSAVFGDNHSFSTSSIGLPGVTRSFTSFDAAAQEAGRSRIYGGIHYEFSNQDGLAAGRALADFVLHSFSVSTDTQAPHVLLDSPEAGFNTAHNFNLTGHVLDNLSGVSTLEIRFDSGSFTNVAFDPTTGNFSVPTSFFLNGSADGTHVLSLRATDYSGNTSALTDFSFTLDTDAPAINIDTPTEGEALEDGARLTGSVSGTGSPLTSLVYSFDGGTAMPFSPSPADGSFDVALELKRVNIGSHILSVTARDAAGNVSTVTRNVQLPVAVPLAITNFTPLDGASDVGTTFRPQVFFSRPVNTSTLNGNNVFATDTTGTMLATTIVPAADGTFAWLFFTNPMPGASTITIHVVGDSILAQGDGQALDADGDGTAGGTLTYQFTTVSLVPLANTSLSGKVVDPGADLKPMTFDDIRAGADGTLHTADDVFLNPIAGVKVFIVGLEAQAVYTDAQGNFSLPVVPSGDVKLAIDGRTATNAPTGFYFPEMVMDLEMEIGQANTVMGTMGLRDEREANRDRKEVYLPRLQTSLLHSVSETQTTTIGVDAVSAPNLTPQQRQFMQLDVPPGSLIGPDGKALPASAAKVGISTVPPELVRDMLPAGVLQHTFDLTLQAPGVAAFDTPVPVTFPNVFNAAPGTQLNFLSFNHTTGMLEIQGTATVSADGLSVRTDPGTGLSHPGWFGITPPGTDPNPCTKRIDYVKVTRDLLIDLTKCAAQFSGNTLLKFVADSIALIRDLERLTPIIQGAYDQLNSKNPADMCHALDTIKALIASNEVANAIVKLEELVLDGQPAISVGKGLLSCAKDILKTASTVCNTYRSSGTECNTTLVQIVCDGIDEVRAAIGLMDVAISQGEQSLAKLTQTVFKGLWDTIVINARNAECLPQPTALASGFDTADAGEPIVNLPPDMIPNLASAIEELSLVQTGAAKLSDLADSLQTLKHTAFDDLGYGTLRVAESVQSMANAFFVFKAGGVVLRGQTDASGTFESVLPPNTPFSLIVFDPLRTMIASFDGQTASSGRMTMIPLLDFVSTDGFVDTDHDGICDEAEDVIGTDPFRASTSGDGISDLRNCSKALAFWEGARRQQAS
jgi:hypothetical protein